MTEPRSKCDGPTVCDVCGDCGCDDDTGDVHICDCCAVHWAQTQREAIFNARRGA